jgi:hypothetical protein
MKGLCECGCGRQAPIATTTDRRKGWTKGEPKRFIQGHSGHRWTSPGYLVDDITGCWNWNGYRRPEDDRAGAKRLKDGSYQSAYRYYYEQKHGAVPEGLVLDHTCRNPRCVNPAHLEPVTQRVNLERANVTHGADGRFARRNVAC